MNDIQFDKGPFLFLLYIFAGIISVYITVWQLSNRASEA